MPKSFDEEQTARMRIVGAGPGKFTGHVDSFWATSGIEGVAPNIRVADAVRLVESNTVSNNATGGERVFGQAMVTCIRGGEQIAVGVTAGTAVFRYDGPELVIDGNQGVVMSSSGGHVRMAS